MPLMGGNRNISSKVNLFLLQDVKCKEVCTASILIFSTTLLLETFCYYTPVCYTIELDDEPTLHQNSLSLLICYIPVVVAGARLLFETLV